MNQVVTPVVLGDPAVILDRHSIRRSSGVPTVSLLVGPTGAAVGTWRRWAAASGRGVVVADRDHFPSVEWVRSVAERTDLSAAAVLSLARRTDRDPHEFLAEWRDRTPADRERFWSTLAPDMDDDLLRMVSVLSHSQASPGTVSSSVSALGESAVPKLVRVVPSVTWPSVLLTVP
jgi:hypothetical protein